MAPAPATLVKAWTSARDRLREAEVDSPVIDARLLVEAAAGVTRVDLISDPYRPLTEEQVSTLDAYVARRSRREPVSHILGRKGFWKIMVQVNAKVLTPRPETEVIVDHALRAFAEPDAFTLLDLGVGSGAILLAILAERPRAQGLGVDVSEEALAVARENAANLGLAGRVAYVLARPGLERLREWVDPRRYNGAIMLGLNGVVVKSHGGTDAEQFAYATDVAIDMVVHRFNDRIRDGLLQIAALPTQPAPALAAARG